MRRVSALLLVCALAPACGSDAKPDDPHRLWNGTDLSEWDGDPAVWRVEGDAIVGRTAAGAVADHTFLIYRDREFGDFVLEAEVWIESAGNSGFYYRATVLDAQTWSVGGYQADVGEPYWGSLYEGPGRATLVDASAGCLESAGPNQWLRYEVRVQGSSFLHHVNGIECARFTETAANRPRDGVLALQYHVPGGPEVRFRKLRLEPLSQ